MKRGTTDLPKFKHLMRDLGLPMYAAMGLLEALWHFTAKAAERGNIGRYTNDDIAEAVGWVGTADVLVGVLTKRGWLDKSATHRLIVHHWHIHADDATKKRVLRSGEGWAYLDDLSADGGQRRTTADNGGQRQPVSDMTSTNESHGCLPEPEPEPEPEPRPQPVGVVGDAVGGDPWAKPPRYRPAATMPVNPHLAEASAMLREFGFNVSNAAKYGASLNATPERVRWLCSEAKRLAESGKIAEPIGFVVAGIRAAKDPDPGPAVASPQDQIQAILDKRRRAS